MAQKFVSDCLYTGAIKFSVRFSDALPFVPRTPPRPKRERGLGEAYFDSDEARQRRKARASDEIAVDRGRSCTLSPAAENR
jgi:hypothetical protein